MLYSAIAKSYPTLIPGIVSFGCMRDKIRLFERGKLPEGCERREEKLRIRVTGRSAIVPSFRPQFGRGRRIVFC